MTEEQSSRMQAAAETGAPGPELGPPRLFPVSLPADLSLAGQVLEDPRLQLVPWPSTDDQSGCLFDLLGHVLPGPPATGGPPFWLEIEVTVSAPLAYQVQPGGLAVIRGAVTAIRRAYLQVLHCRISLPDAAPFAEALYLNTPAERINVYGLPGSAQGRRRAHARLEAGLRVLGKMARQGRPRGSTVLPDFPRRYLEAYARCRAQLEQDAELPTQVHVAHELAVSPATLRRRIAEHGLSWPPIISDRF